MQRLIAWHLRDSASQALADCMVAFVGRGKLQVAPMEWEWFANHLRIQMAAFSVSSRARPHLNPAINGQIVADVMSQRVARFLNLFEIHHQTVDPTWAVPELSVKSLFADTDGVDEGNQSEMPGARAE